MMKRTLFAMMTAAGLVAAANAQDEGKEAGAEIGGDAKAAEKSESGGDIGKLLKDQLIKIEGEKATAAKFDEGMEYYLVYHSASW